MRPGLTALRGIPLLASFGDQWLEMFNGVADLAGVGPDEVLLNPGDPVTDVTFLLTGQIVAVSAAPRGDTVPTDVLLPVRPLCLQAALLGLSAPVGLKTATSVRLVSIPAVDFRTAISGDPANATALLHWALTEVQELSENTTRLKLQSSAQRLAEYLLKLAQDQSQAPARLVLPFEKRLLAAKIGCSQENLSRAFAALKRVGVVTQHSVVVIADPHALRAYIGADS